MSCAETIPDAPRTVRAYATGPNRTVLARVAYDAQRAALRDALVAAEWSLTAAARALGYVAPGGQVRRGDLLREVDKLDLRAEYDDALAVRRAK